MSYVLLIEDEEFNRTVVEDIFEFDFELAELVCVESGEAGIEQANRARPDLILMDIGLPGIDGLEATRRLKASANTRAIAVWALTAHAMKGDKQKATAAGCNAYLTKPIDTGDFVLRLENFFADRSPRKDVLCEKS
jgi:two-component system cell cycle response regulator DivK